MSEENLDIKVTLNQQEVMTNLNNAVAHVLKSEMIKSVRDEWKGYHFEHEMSKKLREIMLEEGEKVRVKGLNYTHTLEEDYYLVKHSSRTILSRSSNFEYDYKYNRKIKLKKINKL